MTLRSHERCLGPLSVPCRESASSIVSSRLQVAALEAAFSPMSISSGDGAASPVDCATPGAAAARSPASLAGGGIRQRSPLAPVDTNSGRMDVDAGPSVVHRVHAVSDMAVLSQHHQLCRTRLAEVYLVVYFSVGRGSWA